MDTSKSVLLAIWAMCSDAFSIEDPFAEDDAHGWIAFTRAARSRVQIVGDDFLGHRRAAHRASGAVGWNAGQLKVGSFARSERMAKWNEVLRIETRWGRPRDSPERVRWRNDSRRSSS